MYQYASPHPDASFKLRPHPDATPHPDVILLGTRTITNNSQQNMKKGTMQSIKPVGISLLDP
jgi:hypothetical protein